MAMTVDSLQARVAEVLDCGSLLQYVDFEASLFDDMPRFFEVSHFCMELCLTRPSEADAFNLLVAEFKRDLEQEGIELEYTLAVQQGSASRTSGVLEYGERQLVLKN
jgi:hypothetical protein